MRIAMMGSGGLGGCLGIRLAQAGHDVVFVARGTHLAAMRKRGLRLLSPLGDAELAHVSATDSPTDAGVVDLIIFVVKLYDTEQAAGAMLPMVGPETRVLTLQNGVDSVDELSRFVPRQQIVGGTTYIASTLSEPGVIVQVGITNQVLTGSPNDAVIARLCETCSTSTGVALSSIEDVDQIIWRKFVTLSAFSGATTLMRSGIGKIMADTEARAFLESLFDEALAISAAVGHPMPDNFHEATQELFKKIPPETKSSMTHDLERGKPIELKWLSGRVHELGLKHGIATPRHTAVYQALHLYQHGSNS